MRRAIPIVLTLLAAGTAPAADEKPLPVADAKPLIAAEVLAAAQPGDWRRPDPDNTMYLDFAAGRVIIELAPRFAPQHVKNLQALVRAKFFDGLPVGRVQDNYVTQWGDIDEVRTQQAPTHKLPDETFIAWNAA